MKMFLLGAITIYMTVNICIVAMVIIHEWKDRKNFKVKKLLAGIILSLPMLIKYIIYEE